MLAVKIKSKTKLLAEHTTTQRLGIYDMVMGDTKTPILIDILKNQPEDWDRDGVNQDTIPAKKNDKKSLRPRLNRKSKKKT